MHEDLLRHVGGRLHDDTALLLVSAGPAAATVRDHSATPSVDQRSGQPA
jgi:hypothetical protein